jgi:hypothetical protein
MLSSIIVIARRSLSLAAILVTTSCSKSAHETVKYEPISPEPVASGAPVVVDQPAPTGDPPSTLVPAPAPTPFSPPPSLPPAPPTVVLPANNHAIDPTSLIAGARAYAPPGARLRKINVRYVGSNGRVDLGASTYKASIRYSFRVPPIPAQQTPGAPVGVVTPAQHFPDIIVTYEGAGGRVYYDELGDSLGSNVEPQCTLAQVWAGAIAAGAPRDAVANVMYPASLSAHSWNFYIEGTAANGAPLFHVTIDDTTCRKADDLF